MSQMSDLREWGGRFVVPIPGFQIADLGVREKSRHYHVRHCKRKENFCRGRKADHLQACRSA